MTNQMENSGPPSGTWAWAIQREIDNLQKTFDARYTELASRIDRVVSSTEYGADKRAADQQHRVLMDKLSSIEKDLELYKKEINDKIETLRKDHDLDIDKVGLLLNTEKSTREAERREDASSRLERKRWVIAAVALPILLVLVQAFLNFKTG